MHAWGAYAAYNHKQTPFRDEDSQVYVMVRVAKGELTTDQYKFVTALDGTKYRVSKTALSAVLEIFGQYGAQVLSLQENALLVPVPASSHVKLGSPFTGEKLAEAIAKKLPAHANVKTAPILAFNQVMPRASKGESQGRDKAFIRSHLISSETTLVGKHVILIDDVCTSGSHLTACAEFLRAMGATVELAVCIGKTSSTQHPTPLAVPPEDIENQFAMFFGR